MAATLVIFMLIVACFLLLAIWRDAHPWHYWASAATAMLAVAMTSGVVWGSF